MYQLAGHIKCRRNACSHLNFLIKKIPPVAQGTAGRNKYPSCKRHSCAQGKCKAQLCTRQMQGTAARDNKDKVQVKRWFLHNCTNVASVIRVAIGRQMAREVLLAKY
jgi:hypothetical protein